MPQATQRRSLRHKNVPFVISTTGPASSLAVNGKQIPVVKQKNNRYRTHYLPYAEFKDLESLAREVIEVHPTLR